VNEKISASVKVSRKAYSEEFKREAVRLAVERGNVSQVARELGINDNLLFRWKQRLESTPEQEKAFPGNGNVRDEQMAKLQRELARLKEDNEILKKAVGIFTKETR
jgi:transposase